MTKRQKKANPLMNRPTKIALFTKPDFENDIACITDAIDILTAGHTHIYLHSRLKNHLADTSPYLHYLSDESDLIEAGDMLLVFGGDGTMLDYSVRAAEKGKPVLGNNCGHLGFLTAMEREETQKLSHILQGDYKIEKRMLLDAEIEDGGFVTSYRAMNEIVVGSAVHSRIAAFSLSSETGKLLDYRADGLIIATPTGSTAYSLSAGGPVIEPEASLFAVTPICPHSLLRGSVILSSDAHLTLSGETKDLSVTDIYFAVDGKHSRRISKDALIRIQKSPYTAGIVKIGENRFYDILETKLNRK